MAGPQSSVVGGTGTGPKHDPWTPLLRYGRLHRDRSRLRIHSNFQSLENVQTASMDGSTSKCTTHPSCLPPYLSPSSDLLWLPSILTARPARLCLHELIDIHPASLFSSLSTIARLAVRAIGAHKSVTSQKQKAPTPAAENGVRRRMGARRYARSVILRHIEALSSRACVQPPCKLSATTLPNPPGSSPD